MKKILLTGSEGYIGSILCPMLIKNNYDILGIDNCYYSEGNITETSLPFYQLIKKDIRDIEVDDLVDKKINAIVHLAALSNDPLGFLDEELTYDINYRSTVRLAEIAKSIGISKFIFASSCSLYGQGVSVLTEDSPTNPQTPYGKSKILAEKELYKMADDSFSPTFLRNATAFGISPRMRFDIVVNNLTGFAHVDGEIKILGDGKPWRPLVHVKDICRAIISTLDGKRKLIHNQSFNIGDNNENYQIKTIAKKVQDHFNSCHISIAQQDAKDTRDYNVSFNKVNKVLGFQSKWSLNRGIKEIRDVYTTVKLDNEKFNNRLYTRLKQINYLLENKKIDLSLRRITS